MYRQILHTPEGVRDIYNEECRRKNHVQQVLHQVFHSYGYEDIQTPTFEFFDVFSREVGTVPSRELFKFFDREGNTLVLRPDITPSIARAVTKYFSEEDMPVRLCYTANTFINHSDFQGRLKENTQMGAELIGDGSVEADAELIALVAECLLGAGLTEFQVSIGHVDFFKSLLREARLTEEMELELREFISNKNIYGVLKTIYGLLACYGYAKYVAFDLGVVSKYRYYTGIIFQAYTYGTGDAVAKGGRYDTLMDHFGKSAPATGFAFVLDRLMNALSRQKVQMDTGADRTLIVYRASRSEEAIRMAMELRRQGRTAELMPEQIGRDYEAYAEKNGVREIRYVKGEEPL